MNIALVFALLVAIIAVMFAFQNPETMDVKFLGYESRDASKALILLITFALGVITGGLASLPGRVRARGEARRAEKENATLRKQMNSASGAAISAPAAGTAPIATAPIATTTTTTETTRTADPYTARFGEPPHKV